MSTDFEHIITFLDDAPSQFADRMREAFEEVLRDRLNRIHETQGGAVLLYKVLLDIYNIEQCPEILQGIITTMTNTWRRPYEK